MSRNNTAELILGANNQRLRQGLASSTRDIQTFSTRTRRMLSGLGTGLMRGLGSIPAQLGFVGGTAGLFMLGRNIVKFDNELNKLSIRGKMTAKEMFELKDGIFSVGLEVGRSQESIVEGIATIQEKTGNFKFAVATYKDLAKASQATGASMEELSAMAAQLDDKFKIKPTGLMEVLDVLTGQGEEGAFTLEHLATQGERMLSAAQRLGMRGAEDLKRFGAYAQVAMSATGDAAVAATVVERTISELIEKQAKLKKDYNIDVMDKGGNYREFDELLKEIITKTKGSELKLGEIFSERAIKGVSLLAAAFRENGGFGKFDEYLKNEYGGTVARFLEGRTKSISVQFERLGVLMTRVGESAMLPSLEKINKYLEELLANPDKLKKLDNRFKLFGKTIRYLVDVVGFLAKNWKLLGGAFASYKLASFIVGRRGGGAASALGGALGGGGPAIPVYVVNMGAGLGGIPGTIPTAATATALKMGVSTLAMQIGFFGLAAYAIADAIKKQYDLEKQLQNDVDFYTKTGIKRVLTTAGSEWDVAPAASLVNQIRLDIHVDKDGKLTGASVLDSPAAGVNSQTFLESVFTGGDK